MNYVFGPVPSRRLGASLGVNVIPKKYCSFDCLYCEVGKTDHLTTKRQHFFPPKELIEVFKGKYELKKEKVDVVTITGAGEPTLNIDLGFIASEIKRIIDKPLAILTNSSLIFLDDVKRELMNFDIVVPSLDAVSEDIFKKINKPANDIKIDKIIDGLRDFSKGFNGEIYIEILLVKGINDDLDELKKIAETLSDINYTKVQLNTVFRPAAYENISGLDENELVERALYLSKLGVKVEPVGNFLKRLKKDELNLKNEILTLLEMRPCSKDDLIALFGTAKVLDSLNELVNEGSVMIKIFDKEEFFVKNDL